MKAALRKNLGAINGSYTVKCLTEPYFDPNWHFHPHYQLFLVEEGTGTRFIGDSIRPFSEGDLVFLGPNLPHLWRSDARYHEPGSGLLTQGIVVYFAEDFLGDAFFGRPEMGLLQQLLSHAHLGLEWRGETRRFAEESLRSLAAQPPTFGRLLNLLGLLDTLSQSAEYAPITSPGYTNTMKPSETNRMQLIHTYVLENYRDLIQLNDVAGRVGMSPSAFCRYFKAHANRTFSAFITEIRVGQACKLLLEDNLNVTQISYECGFRTLSNFNQQFKKVTAQTPSQYKRAYRVLA